MNIRKIRLIIVLTALSLFVMIGVQLYWATSSIRLSKKTFESNAMEAMKKTIEDYNSESRCFELFSKIRIQPKQGIYMIMHPWENKRFISNDSMKPDTIPMYFAGANDAFPFHYKQLYFSRPVDMEMILRFEYIEPDSTSTTSSDDDFQSNINVHNFRERFSASKNIEQRYEPQVLDSMLRENFRNYAITDSFHFGYERSDSLVFDFQMPGTNITKLRTSSLRFPMGTDLYFSKPYNLVLYFDNQDRVLLSGLRFALLLSVLVILILLTSFFSSIRIIFQQRKLSELQNDFINNMTHEFKSPLANISIALETIEAEPENNIKKERVFKIIGQEAERLQENVEKILQVARFEQGSVKLSIESLDINQLAQKAISYFETNNLNFDLKILNTFNASPGIVQADETHLLNALYNLIDNAIKYSEGVPVITIKTENIGSEIIISVKDQGLGMKKDFQKKIFEKFYRGSKGNVHRVPGFGLGLSYVKSIIDAHGGWVEVKSQYGKGSEFIIHLPQNTSNLSQWPIFF